jgi:hypothetical protein
LRYAKLPQRCLTTIIASCNIGDSIKYRLFAKSAE